MYACDYLENGVLNVLRGVTFAAPAKVYLALYLNDPGEDGASGTEVSYAGYKRIEIDFSSPAETNGGIGIYVGGGLAVECTPAWKNGVQITAVANIRSKSGYNARKWKKWGKIPYVTYEEEIDMSNEELKALIRQTVKEVLDEENPVYKDLKDVPEYWKGAAVALLDSGAVNGGTPRYARPPSTSARRPSRPQSWPSCTTRPERKHNPSGPEETPALIFSSYGVFP